MHKNSILKSVYKDSLCLLTDLYELTMAYGYWKNGLADRRAVFQLFFRKYPFGGAYAVCAGIEIALEFIQNFRFDEGDLTYLESLKNPAGGKLFETGFLIYLKDFKMTVNVDALEEGTPIFPYEPLLRVDGPIIQAQIIESALLNIVNFQTLIATKASRICYEAKGDQVVEFGVRRAQGIDGAISASRASFIGGCHATSNVLAGKLFSIPVMGTQAHSWIMAFEDEKKAFYSFAKAFPKNTLFLIDTYDTIGGAKRAIEIGKELRKENIELMGVRLDSGDLNQLSQEVRKLLDDSGFKNAAIMASNELTEEVIRDLKNQGAKIGIWGVGTNLVTGRNQPALDGVYKLTAVEDGDHKWKYCLKISEQVVKTTHPGISQVRRYFDGKIYVADMLYDEKLGVGEEIVHHTDPGSEKKVEAGWQHSDLLIPMLREGKSVYDFPSLEKIREKTLTELNKFDSGMRRLLNPHLFYAGMEKNLFRLKIKMMEEIKK